VLNLHHRGCRMGLLESSPWRQKPQCCRLVGRNTLTHWKRR